MRKYSLLCIRWIFVVSFSLYLLLIIFCCCIPLSSLCSLLFFYLPSRVPCRFLYLRVILLCISLSLINSNINTMRVFITFVCCALFFQPQPLWTTSCSCSLHFNLISFYSVHWCSFRSIRAPDGCVCVHLLYVISRKHLLQWNASDFYIFFFVLLCVLFSESCIVLWTLRGFCCWEYCKGRRNNNLYFIQSRISSTCLFLLCLSTFSLHLDPLTCICPTIPNQRGKKCRVT